MRAIQAWQTFAADKHEHDEDQLLTVGEIAKLGGISDSTFHKLPAGQRPRTRWLSDVQDWARWMTAVRKVGK